MTSHAGACGGRAPVAAAGEQPRRRDGLFPPHGRQSAVEGARPARGRASWAPAPPADSLPRLWHSSTTSSAPTRSCWPLCRPPSSRCCLPRPPVPPPSPTSGHPSHPHCGFPRRAHKAAPAARSLRGVRPQVILLFPVTAVSKQTAAGLVPLQMLRAARRAAVRSGSALTGRRAEAVARVKEQGQTVSDRVWFCKQRIQVFCRPCARPAAVPGGRACSPAVAWRQCERRRCVRMRLPQARRLS